MDPSRDPPFPTSHQLNWELDDPKADSLPGYPNLPLENHKQLWDFLETEFWAQDLHQIADKLWWMTMQNSGNISPLHRQIVKRRNIVITEDPKMHLIWLQDRIFIKPLPRYLLSHAFWKHYLRDIGGSGHSDRRCSRIRTAALGYLRTYYYLIRFESDFRLAQDSSLQLIPPEVTWKQFCSLLPDLAAIDDHHVSARYFYGEIRLARLNFYAPVTLRRWNYARVENQSAAYFARFYGPLLLMVGIFSIALTSLQVTLDVNHSQTLDAVALVFSVLAILVFLILSLSLGLLFVFRMSKEWKYALHVRARILAQRGDRAEVTYNDFGPNEHSQV